MTKYMREKGRIRSQEKAFDFEMGGSPDPKHAVECVHGWYHEKKIGSSRHYACVKCGKPEVECVADMLLREEDRQDGIRKAQEGE